MRFQAGHPITDKVKLVRELGRGAMGEVWLAENTALAAEVAVKILRASLVESKQAIERFRQEARAAAQIKSPHVVQIFDQGITPEGDPYIVMELLAGEDLGKHIKREGAMDPGDVALLLEQAGRALHKAHAAGVVHRDIKPANIFLLEGEGRVFIKLVDFGIAKIADGLSPSMTASDALLGTPYYMSPEQLMSPKYVDHRADVWALGVVAYHCLTGHVPFDGETIGALSLAVAKADPTPVTALRKDLPSALDAWFARALARDVDARFQSAEELADAFREAISAEDDAPKARPAKLLTPVPRAPEALTRTLTEGEAPSSSTAAGEALILPSTLKGPPLHAMKTLKSGDETAPPAAHTHDGSPGGRATASGRAVLGVGIGVAGVSLLLAALVLQRPLQVGTPASTADKPTSSSALPQPSSSSPNASSSASAPMDAAPPPVPSPSAVVSAPPQPSSQPSSAQAISPRASLPALQGKDLAVGARCAAASQCASGFCADGVCCDTPCKGTCEACTGVKKRSGGEPGYCGYVTGGEDPDHECGAGKRCNGQGSCVSLTREQIRRLTGHD